MANDNAAEAPDSPPRPRCEPRGDQGKPTPMRGGFPPKLTLFVNGVKKHRWSTFGRKGST